jgi:hypothetical protein
MDGDVRRRISLARWDRGSRNFTHLLTLIPLPAHSLDKALPWKNNRQKSISMSSPVQKRAELSSTESRWTGGVSGLTKPRTPCLAAA